MTLSPMRTRAYCFGALTGGFAAMAAVARRDGRDGVAAACLTLSAACGTLAVAHEERAQARARAGGGE